MSMRFMNILSDRLGLVLDFRSDLARGLCQQPVKNAPLRAAPFLKIDFIAPRIPGGRKAIARRQGYRSAFSWRQI